MRFYRIFIGALWLVLAIPAPSAFAQILSSTDISAISGNWRGHWTSPDGYDQEATMHLTVTAQGEVTGDIFWTLRKSPRASEKSKIGMTGVEHIRGVYYSNTGALVVDGYDKIDNNGILSLDKYRLFLSDNRKVLAGITSH